MIEYTVCISVIEKGNNKYKRKIIIKNETENAVMQSLMNRQKQKQNPENEMKHTKTIPYNMKIIEKIVFFSVL